MPFPVMAYRRASSSTYHAHDAEHKAKSKSKATKPKTTKSKPNGRKKK